MSPKPDDCEDPDRERILARRAVFVTTALAALSCSPATQQNPQPDASVVPTSTGPTATTAPTGTATPTGSATATGPSSLRDWKDVIADMPPLDVAASLPAADKEDLNPLRERLGKVYEKLGAAWQGVPTNCPPKDCKPKWAAAAEAIHEAHDSVETGLCGEWGGLGVRQRRDEHRAFIQKITTELDTGLSDAALKMGDATTWGQLVTLPQKPHPCLKCAMPQDPGVMAGGDPVVIAFADGASTVGADAESVVAKISAETKAIIIRGHADPGEKDAAKLSQARADAVKKLLVKKGVKATLSVVAMGADLPIASSKTDAGRAKNRRVDLAYPPVKR